MLEGELWRIYSNSSVHVCQFPWGLHQRFGRADGLGCKEVLAVSAEDAVFMHARVVQPAALHASRPLAPQTLVIATSLNWVAAAVSLPSNSQLSILSSHSSGACLHRTSA